MTEYSEFLKIVIENSELAIDSLSNKYLSLSPSLFT